MRSAWNARTFFYACAALSLVTLLWPLVDPKGVALWMRLARQEQQLQTELREMRQRIEFLQQMNERLQTDLSLIEKIAREQLMYARPDEQVIPVPLPETPEEEEGGKSPEVPGPRPPADR
jgi:cell division protein FtsB